MAGAFGTKADAVPSPTIAAYAKAIRSFLARRIAMGADLDDLVQEVFARLVRREAAGPVQNREGYLFEIAANLLVERRRREDVRREAIGVQVELQPHDAADAIDPERALLGREACREAVAALNELPARTRTVFVLNRFEDMTAREIARRLGVSASTVEKEMARAIAHLRARLA